MIQDQPPFDIMNKNSDHQLVIVSEHSGNGVPSALSDLGLLPEILNTWMAHEDRKSVV